ncbi:hypothetical protein KY495_10940 [Massilia sp. PAMC28688]|uniref:hypothetical protein n=1 Tax=Massilia sp. PAMC28688 TaxID=2861283 RepID=UPI001C63451B|nr:hypothetical protein [Massilia sp. PAMC28688]QYF95612.1 hypothetical protein KY495_10940 [Massilia sp. PAMC28688]
MTTNNTAEPPDGFNRYAGKPFLVWVDSFILKAIDKLDPDMEAKLDNATPALREAFSAQGSWEDIVMAQLDYTPQVRGAIRDLWAENQARAADQGAVLTPMQFVEVFVAENIMDPDAA